jgi:4-amino-4-deoxy-L-arabinose transferase-like glycosyltransferase
MKIRIDWKLLLFIFGLLAVYGISRFWGIRNLPMFIDELIYARWAQQGFYAAADRLVSFSDGKQPLYIWLVTILMNLIGNPLMAGRVVSIVAGAVTLAGIYAVSLILFNKKSIALMAALLYTVSPMMLLFNRMALYDTLVGMFAVWSLYFEIRLAKSACLSDAFVLAHLFGAALLTKTSGYLNIYLLPVSALLLDLKSKKRNGKIRKWLVLGIFAVLLSQLYNSVIYLSPESSFVNSKNELFIYPMKELLSEGVIKIFLHNAGLTLPWLVTYLTLPIIILVIWGLIFDTKKRPETVYLFLWFFIPFAGLTMFGRNISSRYILFMLIPLFPAAAYFISANLKYFLNNKFILFLATLSLVWTGYFDFRILNNLAYAPIPKDDLFQYSDGWPAGGGMKEIISYLTDQSAAGPIYVASEGAYSSLPATAVEIYFYHNTNVDKRGIGDIKKPIPDDLREIARTKPVYVITNMIQIKPNWPIELVREYRKGNGNFFIRLYKVVI